MMCCQFVHIFVCTFSTLERFITNAYMDILAQYNTPPPWLSQHTLYHQNEALGCHTSCVVPSLPAAHK